MQSYFIWNGIDCRAMGVTMAGAAPIVRGEERVQHVEIPGRSGDVTLTEGSGIFKSYIQTVSISVKSATQVRNVMKWLRGKGKVTFSGQPGLQQDARVIGAVTLNKISHNMDRWAGEVQFYCQPYKERIFEDQLIMTSSRIVYNDGDAPEKPLIVATITAGSTVTITSSSGTFTISMSNLNDTQITIDCEAEEVTANSGTKILTGRSNGAFPVIAPDTNVTIGGSNWSQLVITRRRRYV